MNYLYLVLCFLIFESSHSQNCETLPSSFKDYQTALKFLESSRYSFQESIDTSKSSWIKGIVYYSYDKQFGFLIMETKKTKYIHQGVPLVLWNKLKKATSYGVFYNSYIKGRYQLKL